MPISQKPDSVLLDTTIHITLNLENFMLKKLTETNSTSSLSLLFFIVIATSLFLFPFHAKAKLIDRVVAVVNNDIITLSELNEEMKEYFRKTEQSLDKQEQEHTRDMVRAQLLDQLIDQKIINQQAKIARVTISEQEFERAYRRNIEAMNITEDQLLDELHRAGIPLSTFQKSLRNKLLRDKLIMHAIQSKIIITEEMIEGYYNTVYVSANSQKAYDLLQMGFVYGKSKDLQDSPALLEADKVRALHKANEVHRKVMEGGDFTALARENSDLPSAEDGGNLGFLSLEDMADYMKDPIMRLSVGEVTPVIETPIGYQFFKLLSTQENGDMMNVAPYFEVKEEIRQTLFEKELQKEYKNWAKDIKEKTYIKKML